MVCVAAVALGSSTYAWFVSNIKVDATTTNISAQSNSAYLVIEAGSATTTNSRTSATGKEKTTGNDTALYPAQWKNNFDASGNLQIKTEFISLNLHMQRIWIKPMNKLVHVSRLVILQQPLVQIMHY